MSVEKGKRRYFRFTLVMMLFVTTIFATQPVAAQFRFPRPAIGFPQRPQVQQMDMCAEYHPLGFANRLIEQDITCWHRKMRTGKLSSEPFHSQLQFSAPAFVDNHDNYGLSQAEWLELSDAQLLARFLSPERMNVIIQNFRAGELKAVIVFYLAGQLANEPFLFGPKASPLIESFSIAYPSCTGVNLLEAASGDCAVGFSSLRRRLLAAGIGQRIMHAGQQQEWSLYATAISRSEAARTMPRAQWLPAVARPDSEPYSLHDADNIVLAYRAGLGPAAAMVQRLGNSCSGNGYMRQAMANHGVSLQAATDRAVQMGNAEAARQFSGFTRTGTCGAPADRTMSFRYMLKAAELGDIAAMGEVAGLYADGDGVAENPREAIAWARKAGKPDPAFIARLEQRVAQYDAKISREGKISDVAGKAPNIATIRAVLLRELRWLYENHDMGMQSSLFGMTGGQTEWDENSGTVTMGLTDRMGRDAANLSFRSVQSFHVGSPSCTATTGGYSCRYAVSVFMNSSLGALKLANNVTTPLVTVTDQFLFEKGLWRSPTARTRLLSGLRAAPVSASGNAGRSSLCRSLNAGVAAAGGKSTSSGLDPSTWGC